MSAHEDIVSKVVALLLFSCLRDLKIETFMLSEYTFPPESAQLWASDIGRTPSRVIVLPGYHWLAPVGFCEEKLF